MAAIAILATRRLVLLIVRACTRVLTGGLFIDGSLSRCGLLRNIRVARDRDLLLRNFPPYDISKERPTRQTHRRGTLKGGEVLAIALLVFVHHPAMRRRLHPAVAIRHGGQNNRITQAISESGDEWDLPECLLEFGEPLMFCTGTSAQGRGAIIQTKYDVPSVQGWNTGTMVKLSFDGDTHSSHQLPAVLLSTARVMSKFSDPGVGRF